MAVTLVCVAACARCERIAMARTYSHLDPHQRAICDALIQLSRRHGLWQVFQDWVRMSAISVSNSVDLRQRDAREAEYMQMIRRYEKPELNTFATCLGYLVESLERGFHDALGEIYMALELGNEQAGQFFTPYPVARMMAAITAGDIKTTLEKQEIVTIQEPAAGAGVMILAVMDELQSQKISYQQVAHVTAIDIDLIAVSMCYLQCSLYHIPAVIIHGNGLSLETWSTWHTPAHILGGWRFKLKRHYADDAQVPAVAHREVPQIPARVASPARTPAPIRLHPEVKAHDNFQQMSLF
jgi:hypothetical protein